MKIAVVFICLLLCAGILLAQEGPFDPQAPPAIAVAEELAAYLELTDDQIQALKELRLELREATRQSQRQMAEISRQLRRALRQDPIDSDLVSQLRADIRVRQNNIRDLRSNYQVSALNILTDAQAELLADLEQAIQLFPAARQAIGLNLIEPPEGISDRVGERRLQNRRAPQAERELRARPLADR